MKSSTAFKFAGLYFAILAWVCIYKNDMPDVLWMGMTALFCLGVAAIVEAINHKL
jgi:hypothetical protein